MEYRQGDVRDPDALEEAFAGADVVVHLAFMITGTAARETIRAINVDGTLNVFRAAADAGAQRFVYASSVAAYGFHADNPIGMTEDWPVRPARAPLLRAGEGGDRAPARGRGGRRHPELGLYLLRPPIVLGPHAVGGKDLLPEPLGRSAAALARSAAAARAASRCSVPDAAPAVHPRGRRGPGVRRASSAPARRAPTTSPATACSAARRRARARPRAAPPPATRGAPAARASPALPFAPPFAEWVEAPHPALDHGRDQGQARARLGAALHGSRGVAPTLAER